MKAHLNHVETGKQWGSTIDPSHLKTYAPLSSLSIVLTSTPVPQQVAVHVLNVGVDGGPIGDATWGHVGVRLGVNVLEALPRHAGAELLSTAP